MMKVAFVEEPVPTPKLKKIPARTHNKEPREPKEAREPIEAKEAKKAKEAREGAKKAAKAALKHDNEEVTHNTHKHARLNLLRWSQISLKLNNSRTDHLCSTHPILYRRRRGCD
jgi:hypothetical protein